MKKEKGQKNMVIIIIQIDTCCMGICNCTFANKFFFWGKKINYIFFFKTREILLKYKIN